MRQIGRLDLRMHALNAWRHTLRNCQFLKRSLTSKKPKNDITLQYGFASLYLAINALLKTLETVGPTRIEPV